MNNNFDVTIVGAGLVGLATAWQVLKLRPSLSLSVIEKEVGPALHQSGRNSGVLHSGIYYKPGSLKASNCIAGKKLMEQFCAEHGIPFRQCGKVIVATTNTQLPLLQNLYERAQQNQIGCRLIEASELKELEPHACGIKAIHIPGTGVFDPKRVAATLVSLLGELGAEVAFAERLERISHLSDGLELETTQRTVRTRFLINCAGLYSDVVAKLAGLHPSVQIVPFRGEYYSVAAPAADLCRTLIYPVPDPLFPFLGVHFTRGVDQVVECGPNAVLAFGRESYRWSQFNFAEAIATLSYSGFQKLAARHLRMGLFEVWRSLNKRAFVCALQQLVPEIESQHLQPAPAGIRAQAVAPDGKMVDDFVLHQAERMIHCLNAPSPAATASLNIGKQIAEMLPTTL